MKRTTEPLCQSAIIAALYVVLTVLFAPIGSGAIQLRVSETMALLPVLTSAAPAGLFIGCALANLLSGAVWYDVVFGSLATLIAAILTRRFRQKLVLAAFPPVAINAVVIGLVLHLSQGVPLFMTMLTVGAGEAFTCYGLGIVLIKALKKKKISFFDN